MFFDKIKYSVLLFCIVSAILSVACSNSSRQVNPELNSQMPRKILWAWERPEDLRFIDAGKFGVAFFAQLLYLQNDEVVFRPRRQPLELAPDVYLIAVTRIETNKEKAARPALSGTQRDKLIAFIKRTLERPNVKAIQIDFDVTVSERDFYKNLIVELQKQLPEHVHLTITSLASWCVGDTWFDDFPIDEAVPMAFTMGADSGQVRSFLAAGNDWNEPLCRGSYGISMDEPLNIKLKDDRRYYYFNSKPWVKSDIIKLDQPIQ